MDSSEAKGEPMVCAHIFYRIIAVKVKFQIIRIECVVRNIAVRLNKT
jgi:hypothetical protein